MDPGNTGEIPDLSINEKERLNIFLSAYACEPGKGSEPGVGWRWVQGLAGRVDLTVLTRENNRIEIERELEKHNPADPLQRVSFIYHDLSPAFLFLKRAKLLPTMAYYILWQWTLARKFRNEVKKADIIHHLTFCTPLCPGFWPEHEPARVIGPVGAPLVNPHYLKVFGIGRFLQQLRGILMRHLIWLPWLRSAFHGASAVIPANSESKALLESMRVRCEPVMLDTGAPESSVSSNREKPISDTCHFFYAGMLERRKGLELILRAFAKHMDLISANGGHESRLSLLGDGSDRKRLECLAQELGIVDHVSFLGRVSQHQVTMHFNDADVFVFTSVRDTSGGVNLEAMAAGLPILCIAHQGVGDITDDSCAYRVHPASIDETICNLAEGMDVLANNKELRIKLGLSARKRASECFSWDAKIQKIETIYQRVIKSRKKV